MLVDMRVDICVGMRADMCVDMCAFRHAYGRYEFVDEVCGCAYEHVGEHTYACACKCV